MNRNIYTTQSQIENMKKELEEARTKDKSIKCKSIFKRIINLISIFVIVILIFTLAIITNVRNHGKVPKILGFQLYQVETSSMVPNFKVGSIILTRDPKDKENLKVGDVITFNTDGVIVTHRIIEVFNENEKVKYKTKGDNPNNDPDKDLVTPNQIRGKLVFKLPFSE